MPNLNSDMKALQANSVEFFLFTIKWLDAPKVMEKTFPENGSEQKTKKLGVNFNPQFSVIQPSNSLLHSRFQCRHAALLPSGGEERCVTTLKTAV